MGLWNETCVISNLPIMADTPARLVLLVQSPNYHEAHAGYTEGHSLWTPWSLPLPGVYDGYGRIEKVDSASAWNVKLILGRLQEDGVEKPGHEFEQDQRIEDVVADPTLALGLIQNLVHRGRLSIRVSVNRDEIMPAGMCFIREDVYRVLANSPVITDTAVFTAKDRIARFLAALRDTKISPLRAGMLNDTIASFADTEFGASLKDTLANLLEYRRLSEAIGSYGPPGYLGFGSYRMRLCDRIMEGESIDHPDFEAAAVEYGTFEHVLLHFENLRRLWGPQNGAGSQGTGWGSHAVLARHVATVALQEFEIETGRYEDPPQDEAS